MRKNIATLAFVATLATAACNNMNKQANGNTSGDTTQTSMDMPPMANDSMKIQEDWEKFKADARAEIQKNEDSLKAVSAKMTKAGKKAEAKYHEEVSRLEKKNEELKSKLEDYKAQGKDDWHQFKMGFRNDLDTLGQKIKDLAEKIS
jgi:hypothetical protein